MAWRAGFLLFMATACIGAARGQDQPKQATGKPSAKEIFLNPRQMPYSVQDEAPVSPKPKSKPKPKPKPATDQAQSAPPAANGAAPIVQASYSELGLRYTVQKRDGDRTTDMPADTAFHSGDHIQLNVEVNDTGYLYIISQGSSGTWKAMFPSSEIENGGNQVHRGRVYTMPPGRMLTFSGDPGVERLFVIFSRQPVQEIDNLIYSLKGGQPAPASEASSGQPAAKVLSANARPIADGQIAQMFATYSRDLIVEDLGHEQSGQQQEDRSVYVANPKGSPDSRVVADIPLTHK